MTKQKRIEDSSEFWVWHLLGLISPIVIISGNLIGDYWTLAGTILVLGIYPLLDFACGDSVPSRTNPTVARSLQWIIYAHVVLVVAVACSLCWRAYSDGNAWTTWAAALAAGINTGVSGFIVAHEMGHRRPGSLSWWLARLNLAIGQYLHFTVEHNRHHHVVVATAADPASAPRGRGLWSHVVRTVPLQFLSAWQISSRRESSWYRNSVLHGVLIQAAILLLLWQNLSIWVAGALLAHSVVSIFLLEYVNYLQHYGLRRNEGAKQSEMDSWQSGARWSRWTLLELPLHPAHHLKPTQPFWQHTKYADAPTLPTGYYGLFWVCLIPPLWRRWIHPILPNIDSFSIRVN